MRNGGEGEFTPRNSNLHHSDFMSLLYYYVSWVGRCSLPRKFEGLLGVVQHYVGLPGSVELAFRVSSAHSSLQFRSGMLSRSASLTKQW